MQGENSDTVAIHVNHQCVICFLQGMYAHTHVKESLQLLQQQTNYLWV